MPSSLYVSPYIDGVNPRLEMLRTKMPRLLDRLRVRARSLDPETAVVFDTLTNAFVSLSRRDRELLERLAGRRFYMSELDQYETESVERLRSAGLVFREADVFRKQNFDRVPIEINSHCNFRCTFCPVSVDPKPKAFMPMDLFELVLDRVVEAGVSAISLNHYGEPSLDPGLVERIRHAKARGLTVDLYSNFSRFEKDQIREIAELGNVNVVVNLPTLDPEEYRRITGWKLLDRVVENLRYAVSVGLEMIVTVNAPASLSSAERKALKEQIKREIGCDARLSFMESRAGSMTNEEYAGPVYSGGKLNGCYRMLTKIAVNLKGEAFLCCQDYNQEYVLGDLRTHSLREIAEGEQATKIRRWIFGAEEPPESFICSRCEETQSRGAASTPLSVGSKTAWLGESVDTVFYRSALPKWRLFGRRSAGEVGLAVR